MSAHSLNEIHISDYAPTRILNDQVQLPFQCLQNRNFKLHHLHTAEEEKVDQ